MHVDSEKSMNSFKCKKDRSPDYLLNNYFVCQFINNFLLLLLCQINDFFDTGYFCNFFVISRNTETMIESNYWLRMYVPYILKGNVQMLLTNLGFLACCTVPCPFTADEPISANTFWSSSVNVLFNAGPPPVPAECPFIMQFLTFDALRMSCQVYDGTFIYMI